MDVVTLVSHDVTTRESSEIPSYNTCRIFHFSYHEKMEESKKKRKKKSYCL
jgi:hypothetical protein